MITLDNVPLGDIVEVQNVAEAWEEAFHFHFLYRPSLPKLVMRKRATRRSRVRHISVEEYLRNKGNVI